MVPSKQPRLVRVAKSAFEGSRSVRLVDTAPFESKSMMFFNPANINNSATAAPAAPAPDITTLRLANSLFTSLLALMSAARTTTAVPCWSSWKTGMLSFLRNCFSISKQRGAEISSRLIPPKPGAINSTVRTISSTSWVSRQIGHASTSANFLKRAALPSMTGMAASGPIFPRPRTADPSETTATVFRLIVRFRASAGFSAIAMQTRATPGV